MGHYVATDRSDLLCLQVSRLEAATLIADLSRILALGYGGAPEVTVTDRGSTLYRLLFQVCEVSE